MSRMSKSRSLPHPVHAVLAATLATVLLVGCAALDPAVKAARMTQEVDHMIQVYGPACEKLGFQKETDPWRECILRLNEREERNYYETRASMTNCWGHRGFFRCTSF